MKSLNETKTPIFNSFTGYLFPVTIFIEFIDTLFKLQL